MPGFNVPLTNECNEVAGSKEGPYSSKPQAATNLGIIPSNTLETARTHRFRLSVTFSFINGIRGLGPRGAPVPSNTIIDFFPKKIGRPDIEIDTITIHSGQDEIYRPGKQHHQPIEIEFYEIAGDERNQTNFTARGLFNWWRNQTLQYQTSQIQSPDFLNNTVNIIQLDGVGGEIWNYFLYRCWPDKVTPRDHDYTESAIQTTIIRLRYDKVDERRTA